MGRHRCSAFAHIHDHTKTPMAIITIDGIGVTAAGCTDCVASQGSFLGFAMVSCSSFFAYSFSKCILFF